MQLTDALILALIQGATEFLPVSSSGHLAIAGKLLGMHQAPLDFVVTVHFGTLLAVLVYYRDDLVALARSVLPARAGSDAAERAQYRRLLALLLVGTVPAAIAGYLLEDTVGAAFGDIRLVGVALVVTGLLLAVASRLGGLRQMPQTGLRQAVVVGLCQAVALIPGISRSGTTIVGGLGCGFSREWAPRFAFLLSVPVIAGGSAVHLMHMLKGAASPDFSAGVYGLAALVAAASGYLAIISVINSVKRGNLLYFSAYCLLIGFTAIASGFGFTG